MLIKYNIVIIVFTYCKLSDIRELTEWFKVISLRLIWFIKSHPFKSDILCLYILNICVNTG